jgi:hypothetical protein
MTTRDESIRTLAVALWGLDLNPPNVRRIATKAIAASPSLAADLDLGTAWRLAGREGIRDLIAGAIHAGCEAEWKRRGEAGVLAITMHFRDAHTETADRITDALRAALEARPR